MALKRRRSDPAERVKFDSRDFQRQIWHLDEPKLAGGMTDGADLRIDDRGADDADGPEFIARVTVSDEDPLFTTFPYAVNKITIDGKKDDAEWAGAVQVVLDRPQLDAFVGSPVWKSKEDFSAVYSFKWDENAFYVLGEVRDFDAAAARRHQRPEILERRWHRTDARAGRLRSGAHHLY